GTSAQPNILGGAGMVNGSIEGVWTVFYIEFNGQVGMRPAGNNVTIRGSLLTFTGLDGRQHTLFLHFGANGQLFATLTNNGGTTLPPIMPFQNAPGPVTGTPGGAATGTQGAATGTPLGPTLQPPFRNGAGAAGQAGTANRGTPGATGAPQANGVTT